MADFPHSETRRSTLEEIAAAFGDKVVLVSEQEVLAEAVAAEEKLRQTQEHVENTPTQASRSENAQSAAAATGA